MAVPKVFVSSTCFDLGEVREQLSRFIRFYGFEPVLSEHGDVFYHPDLHTHESCIHEVANCQLFILIIGGRFGGEYIRNRNKSITNAEYDAARENNIPVFTYVRKSVLGNQHIYKENKKKKFVAEIEYPAIDNQEYAIDIFEFVDTVRRSAVNNALEGFETFQDIELHLRKQWAGMFYNFLKTREIKSQIDATNHLLSGIRSSSNKLEELVKSLFRSVSEESAEKSISDVEVLENTKQFFMSVLNPKFISEFDNDMMGAVGFDDFDIERIANISPENMTWDEYLINAGLFTREDSNPIDGKTALMARNTYKPFGFLLADGFHEDIKKLFVHGLLKSKKEQRIEILKLFKQ